MGGINHGVFGPRSIGATNGMHILIKLVKRRMRDPGLVKMQGLYLFAKQLLDPLDIVNDPIIGALGQGQNTGCFIFGLAGKRIGLNFTSDALSGELPGRNGPNDTQMITARTQKDWNGTDHGNGMQNGFVAISIYHNNVALSDVGMPDNLVGGRGSIGHEKTMIGVENTRGIALGFGHRTSMIQQLPQLVDRITDISTQHIFTKKLVKHLPDRAFQKCHPARVPRTVPGIGTIISVLHQLTEKWRRHAGQIGACLTNDMAGHKLRSILKHMDKAVQLPQNIIGNMLRSTGLTIQINGNIFISEPQLGDKAAQLLYGGSDQLGGLILKLLIIDRQDKGTGPTLLLYKRTEITKAGHPDHLYPLGLNRLGQRSHPQSGDIFRAIILIDDHYGKTKFHAKRSIQLWIHVRGRVTPVCP